MKTNLIKELHRRLLMANNELIAAHSKQRQAEKRVRHIEIQILKLNSEISNQKLPKDGNK